MEDLKKNEQFNLDYQIYIQMIRFNTLAYMFFSKKNIYIYIYIFFDIILDENMNVSNFTLSP